MNTFELHDTYDVKKFYKICECVQAKYPKLIKEKECTDVDGSIVVAYSNSKNRIVIVCDATWDYIFAETDLNLSNLLS